MALELDADALKKMILVGDRILIRPRAPREKTGSGLFLPPGIVEQEPILSGYVVKVGPGYPIPALMDPEESWKPRNEGVQYLPLQAQEGDLAIYLQKSAWEIEFNKEKYAIIPQNAVLLLVRDEELLG
jgi:chaperonin GroES